METAILIYAVQLGIDLEKETELISIAEKGLKDIPTGWELNFLEGNVRLMH